MASAQDFKSLQDGLQKSLVSAVKTVNRVAAEDLGFQRTINPDVAELLDDRSARFLDLSARLLRSAADTCGLKAPELEDVEDIDMNWRQIVDVVDTALEKADTALDEYTGLIKRKEPPTATESTPNAKRPKPTGKVIRNANMTKPQLRFEQKPDNFPTSPWKPILTEKPHSQISLKKSLVTFTNENGVTQYKHPYETEIIAMEFPPRVFEQAKPIPYQPIDGTEAMFIDTYEGVLEMLAHLKEAKEIAVDLEHHDFRTYTGLVSLMQISTRDQDWIVDTLKPWRHQLQILNQVFADPNIVKVFHGAYMDMVWLQRDLGLYVNGLFDTYFACELLAYQARSLAFLLSKFANFDADKQYQLADWRIRPLPEEMLYYARSDTHYLLYIYDCVRNDLNAASDTKSAETDLMRRALQKSKDVSLSRHEHPTFNEETGEGNRGWYGYILKHGQLAYNAEQFAVFRALWKWRDETARQEDENPNFVLGSNHISEIARINPPDIKALHSLLPPAASVAKPRLKEMWEKIVQARSRGGPSLLQYLSSLSPDALKKNGASAIHKQNIILPVFEGNITVAKLPKSQLFGEMPISSRWEDGKQAPPKQEDHIPFPWQRYVQHISEQFPPDSETAELELETAAQVEEQVSNAHDVPLVEMSDQADEEFTLKRGKKRKSAPGTDNSTSGEEEAESSEGEGQIEDDDEAHGDEQMDDADGGVLDVEDEGPDGRSRKKKGHRAAEQALEKATKNAQTKKRDEKKARKKAEKEQKRKEKAKEKVETKNKYQAVPFDYSQATSVMNAKRNGNTQQDGKKATFDPYAKIGENEIKGARKAPPIRGERSGTFKQ